MADHPRPTAWELTSRQARQASMQLLPSHPFSSSSQAQLDENNNPLPPYGDLGPLPPPTDSARRQAHQAQIQSANPYPYEDYMLENEDGDISTSTPPAQTGFDASRELHARFPWSQGVDLDDSTPPTSNARISEYRLLAPSADAPPLNHTVPEPAAVSFIKNLISLDIDEMAPNEQTCLICSDHYWTGAAAEIPLQLPCGHVFGEHCLMKWLTTVGGGAVQHSNCPMCRTKHVEVNRPLWSEKGLEQLVTDADYLLNRMGPLRLTGEGRKRWEDVKGYVWGYLHRQAAAEYELRSVISCEMTRSIVLMALEGLLDAPERQMLQERLAIAFQEFEEWRIGEGPWFDDAIEEEGDAGVRDMIEDAIPYEDLGGASQERIGAIEAAVHRLPESRRHEWPEEFARREWEFEELRGRNPEYPFGLGG